MADPLATGLDASEAFEIACSHNLSRRLMELRLALGLNANEMARRAGIGAATYRGYERSGLTGKGAMNPDFHTLVGMAHALGKSPSELCQDIEPNDEAGS